MKWTVEIQLDIFFSPNLQIYFCKNDNIYNLALVKILFTLFSTFGEVIDNKWIWVFGCKDLDNKLSLQFFSGFLKRKVGQLSNCCLNSDSYDKIDDE